MANISIWGGSSTFATGSTPFGFYDSDSEFQTDADKVAKFCGTRLGFPLMDVELQSGSFYACFEEAVTTYGNEVFQYKIRENYLNIEGESLYHDMWVDMYFESKRGIPNSEIIELMKTEIKFDK